MVAACFHLDLNAVHIQRFMVVHIFVHEKLALEIRRYIEWTNVQLDSTVRLRQGSEGRWLVTLEVGQVGNTSDGAMLRRTLKNPLQDELELAVRQRIHAQRHQRAVAGVVVVKMLLLGGIYFLPEKTFPDTRQPISANEFQSVLERISIGWFAIDELPISGIRREDELRLARKRRALAVATNAVWAKDSVSNDSPRRGAAFVTDPIKPTLHRFAIVLKYRFLIGGFQQIDIVPVLQVSGAFHVESVTEKLSEIVHRRAIYAELELPRMGNPLRLECKLQSAIIAIIVPFIAMTMSGSCNEDPRGKKHPKQKRHSNHPIYAKYYTIKAANVMLLRFISARTIVVS